MTKALYDYTYTDPSGYSYKGQVVADTDVSKYNYVSGQTYQSPYSPGVYTVSGAGTPTTAPSGAVYQTSYTDATGTYDSYHYDVKDAAYYNINSGYDHATGMYQPPVTDTVPPPAVPAWSGIGLGNEYSYTNTGTPTAPNYQTYGGGGTAHVNYTPTPLTAYDYKFLYPDGSTYYLGKVVDDGTYGYKVGMNIPKNGGTYSIYAQDPTPVTPGAKAGYNYVQLYHDANGTNYPPSDIIPGTPYYQKPVGYGGFGTEHDYAQKPGGYYTFDSNTTAAVATPVAAIPLPN
jgi:hypothetical protein